MPREYYSNLIVINLTIWPTSDKNDEGQNKALNKDCFLAQSAHYPLNVLWPNFTM